MHAACAARKIDFPGVVAMSAFTCAFRRNIDRGDGSDLRGVEYGARRDGIRPGLDAPRVRPSLPLLLTLGLIAACGAPRSEAPSATPVPSASTAGTNGCTLVAEPGTVIVFRTAAPTPPRPISALRPFHIAVLGDSIASGDDGSTALEDRWWSRAKSAIQSARPDRDVVVTDFGQIASGIENLEQTVAMMDARDYQIAIIIEGRNDYLTEAAWSPRYVRVIQALERQGVLVVVGTYPPALASGALMGFSRNPCIRLMAGTTRPLLDLEARWMAAGPTVAAGWTSDGLHSSVAGQLIEAEMATALLLRLMP